MKNRSTPELFSRVLDALGWAAVLIGMVALGWVALWLPGNGGI